MRNVSKMLVLYHLSRYIMTELFNLFPDVLQESVARPAACQHYGVNWDLVQIHRHRRPGSNGVCPDIS